jgi:3-oxoacyl-[acyl-carrier protein] reductase
MGKTAIVTGASRGIGRAIAKRLASDGFAVVVNYAGNAAKAEETVAAIGTAGGRAIALRADVANAADVDRLFKKALETFKSVDVVVNSAGIMPLSPIALSSSVIAKAFPNYGTYLASKAGVEGLVHVLANELRGRNITVNAVAPGPVATELFLAGKTEGQIAQFSKLSPLERLGQTEDLAAVVSFLAGPDGGWVNAQVLRANGGFA